MVNGVGVGRQQRSRAKVHCASGAFTGLASFLYLTEIAMRCIPSSAVDMWLCFQVEGDGEVHLSIGEGQRAALANVALLVATTRRTGP